jgi:hypothetical protein
VPIVTPEAPKSSIEALHATLPALAGSAGIKKAAPSFAASLAAPRSLANPGFSYAVYLLGLGDIASGASIKKAKLSSWRHEFTSGKEVVSAEISAGRHPKFSQLSVNSLFRSVQHELKSAAAGEVFAGRSYEATLLQISALGVRALWLRSKPASRGDILIPLAPVRSELTANRHYAPAEFVAALKSAAKTILAADARGKGG